MARKDSEERRAYNRAYYAAHREERRTYDKAHREEQRAQGRTYDKAHREQIAGYNRAYRAVHLETCRANSRTWAKSHHQEHTERNRRRRALKRGATVGPIDLEAIKARDRMLCAICGRRVAAKDFSLDHTIPLSLGGPHSQENLRRGAGRLPVQMVLC